MNNPYRAVFDPSASVFAREVMTARRRVAGALMTGALGIHVDVTTPPTYGTLVLLAN